MQQELAHSLNIKLDDRVFDQITEIQKRLCEKFQEQRTYDPSPHLSALHKFFDRTQTDRFIALLEAEFQNEACWDLKLTNFSLSSTGDYIFLNLDDASREKVMSIHERAVSAVGQIGTLGQGGAPAKYVFDPHISIIKLLPEESPAALALLNNELDGVGFRVGTYTITTDDENGTGNIKVLKEILLEK